MIPEFDPAAVRLLHAFSRHQGATGDAIGPDDLIRSLVVDGDPVGSELSRDPRRVSEMLTQLVANGLLEPVTDVRAPSIKRYRLTSLGRSRLERSDERDDGED
jgi:DNA-binding MarR family transcriptional regulator